MPMSQQTIAFKASPPDSKSHMWADPRTRGIPPAGVICDACGQRIDYKAINPEFRPKVRNHDLMNVYDGDYLVSTRLRDYLRSQQIPGISFEEVPKVRGLFVLQSDNILKLHPPATLRMEEFCSVCGQYKSVYGLPLTGKIVPLRFEGVNSPLERGIFITDLIAGYGPLMGPLLVFGVETWADLVRCSFRGIHGRPIVN
jgi:hypothetical protein